MKKRKGLSLTLNKKKVSELSVASQQKIMGGASYGSGSYCQCPTPYCTQTQSLSCSGGACG